MRYCSLRTAAARPIVNTKNATAIQSIRDMYPPVALTQNRSKAVDHSSPPAQSFCHGCVSPTAVTWADVGRDETVDTFIDANGNLQVRLGCQAWHIYGFARAEVPFYELARKANALRQRFRENCHTFHDNVRALTAPHRLESFPTKLTYTRIGSLTARPMIMGEP